MVARATARPRTANEEYPINWNPAGAWASAPRPYGPGDYRFPFEHGILALTLGLVLLVIAVTATATLCGSALFVALMTVAAYYSTRAHHAELMQRAYAVTPESAPQLAQIVESARGWLQAEPVHVFVLPSPVLNAYTFGLSSPKVVVVNAGLLQLLDADELAFVLSHELAHVRLGHTWLNSLVGGLSGIPSPSAAFALMRLAFLWWNRACEHSADRGGLLATARPQKAISALVKLALGPTARAGLDLEAALRQLEVDQDQVILQLGEALATHPSLARRIAELRRYAASPEYRRLAALRAVPPI